MKLSMVFHCSAKFLMNRFIWVSAKICVLLWTGKSFTVVYLNAALASVERRNLKCMSGDHLVICGFVTICVKI